jgi:hypothetical protein
MNIIELIKDTDNYSNLIKKLENTNIKIKESSDNLILLYTDFVTNSFDCELEESCRNVIIEKDSLKLVAYGQPKIKYNDYCIVSELQLKEEPKVITESIEGTLLMLYYNNNKWSISTRKTIDAGNSYWKSTKSHLELFKECISNYDDFLLIHDINRIYLYVLVHFENKNLIDYSKRFGSEYKKAIFILSRDVNSLEANFVYNINTQEFNLNEHNFKNNNILEYINLPIKYDDYSILDEKNHNEEGMNNIESITDEGILISSIYEGKEIHIKLQTQNYRVYQETCSPKYNIKSNLQYIYLYQKNNLDIYLTKFEDEMFYKASDNQLYQIKGLVDCVFKVFTSEILFMFKLLWDIRYGTQKEEYKEFYYKLSSEYKKIFYHLRGIYFTKKANEDLSKKYITMKTVYDLLKEIEPELFLQLIIDRQNLFINCEPKIKSIFDDFYKSEYIVKPLRAIDVAIEFLLSR